MAKKASTNGIRDINENWSLDNRNNLPYSGASVEAFIKNTFKGKAGEFYYDADTTKYLVFASVADRDLYLTNRETYASLLLGSFDAPANYTAEIHVTTPASNTVLSGTKGNYIDFTFDVKNRTGSSTGESVIATYTFNNGGNVKKVTQVYNAGTNVHFLLDEYLSDGTNNVNVVVTGRNTLVSTMASVIFDVVNLQLTSTFDYSKVVEVGNDLNIPFSLKGGGLKTVEWFIDGVTINDDDIIAIAQSSQTKKINTTGWETGKHSLQIRAYITDKGNNFYSKTLYFDFVVAPAGGIFVSNQTFVLLGLTINSPVTSTLSISLIQYEEFNYSAAIFDTRNRNLNLVVEDNNTQVQSISIQSEAIQELTYMPVTTGTHSLTFTADEATANITVNVQDSGLGIDEVTEGLVLKLNARGRNNNETNPATWTHGTTTTTFNNFQWNDQCGWKNGALVIPAGSSIDIAFAPLANTPVGNGRTIEIDFETADIEDETANIINLINSTTNAGINIKPTSAKLQSAGGAAINTRFRDGDRLHLTFIINKITGDDARFIYIVNNGILERAERFAASDNFNVTNQLHIGSTGCTIKLHSIKVYNKALTVDEAFQNYAINSDNIVAIVNRNDIINSSTSLIDADKVNAQIPIMIITGNIDSILSISDKSHKNDWNTNPVNIEYRNIQNPELNFFIDDADIRLQGTSSISYPRKNFRIYSKSKSGKYATKLYTPTHNSEDLVANGKYAFREGSAPVSCWCLKADYAESSGSHNTGIAKLWNTLMKNTNNNGSYILRTAAQAWAAANEYPYDVRTTIDGFPIVLFQRDSVNAPLVCLGQYNFNNDKSTEEVFGFTALSKDGVTPFDNSNVQCWEVLDSDNNIALFRDISDFDNSWSDAFEARYPDKNTNVTALKTVAQFINSCYDSTNDTVDVATWRADKASHFDLNKLAAYYIYLLRFGAVDQTVKNAMFTTEDGVHWFYINYDNDTILGIDNESRQFDVWDYGLFTQTPNGGYYYAGKGKSVLWRLFEADSECMTLARQIDALLFNAGLKYETVCAMFDDEQSGKWCERIYNENGRYKYISQALEGKNVLHMLQGSRKSHRHWWLQHRFEKYDNVFGNGTYSIRSIQARATGTVNIPQGAAYKYTPAISTYFGYGVASTTVDAPTLRTAGVEYTATGLPQETGVGNLIYIYNANNIAIIDLSAYISALGSLNIGDAKDVNGNSRLTKLILGDGVNNNVYLTAISGLKDIISLEEVDIRGFQAITSMDFEYLVNLHVLKAVGSGLTSFAPASGAILTNIELPATLQTLVLNGNTVTALSVASYTDTSTSVLRNVTIKNVTGTFDVKTFVNAWLENYTNEQLTNFSLTLYGINWTNVSADSLIHLGHIGTKDLRGTITLSSMSYSQYQSLVELFGSNAFGNNASFRIIAPDGVYISGPTSLNYGATGQYTATVYPNIGQEIEYQLYNGSTKVPTQYDGQGQPYAVYGGVTLYEATGAVSVDSGITNNVTVKIKAHIKNTDTYSTEITLTAKKAVYPTISISGVSAINQNSTVNFTKLATIENVNTTIQSVLWSLSNNASGICSLADATADPTCALVVSNTPSSAVTITLTCLVTFTDGHTETATKNIEIALIYPTAISISGDATIDSNGNKTYTFSETGSKTASLISAAWTLTSNEYVTCAGGTNNSAIVGVANGNPTAVTLTLTCVATYTGNVTRTATKSISVAVIEAPPTEEWVDLGLPSGLLWCTHNIGATNPEDAGLYFAWGETTGYVDAAARNTALGLTGGFDSTAYTQTGASSIAQTSSVSKNLTLAQDAANVNMGLDWRMPSKDETQELYDNTDREWTSVNGVNGCKFMKKSDNSVYIFIPAAGFYYDSHLNSQGTIGRYWSSSSESTNNGYNLYISSSQVYPQSTYARKYGLPIRAVRQAPVAVDLGLPSGTLWCDRNVGATAPEEAGLYFAWGETEGYKDAADRNAKLTAETGTTYTGGFDSTSYNRPGGASGITGNLSGSNDAASVNLGGSWRMPTGTELRELKDNTNTENITINNVSCLKFMKRTDNSVYIILPKALIIGNNIYNSNSQILSSTLSNEPEVLQNTDISLAHYRYYGYLIRAVQ